ncbi:Cytochrome P450 CYP749A22 [Linum perenne]
MLDLGTLVFFLSSFLCLYLLLIITRFLNKGWPTPIRVQDEGTRNQRPFLQILPWKHQRDCLLRIQAAKLPMELSHRVLPRLQPHIYSWTKLYGNNFLQWYGSRAQLVVTEPELIKEVLNCRDGAFEKTGLSLW